jgi:hypothetical protein
VSNNNQAKVQQHIQNAVGSGYKII